MEHPIHFVSIENGEPHWIVKYRDREYKCDFNDVDLRETEREIVLEAE